jgi:2-polyprenyl-6-methoxyphenol hydroxylase-like FAD-dependent oxidoreductase
MEETKIIIIGAGPTGVLLSAYLGRLNVKHIVLEKDPHITTDPREIVLDDDGIRTLQGLGIYEKIWKEIAIRELFSV